METRWDDAVAGHRLSTRSRLITATVSLLAEHGMAGTTMTAIADRAGVSRPTLYKHFPDVDHIIAALARQEFAAFREELDALIDPGWSGVDKLDALIRAHLRYFASEPDRIGEGSFEAGMSPVVREAVESELVDHHARIVDVITEGIGDGSFDPDLDPALTAELIQHVLGGMRHTVNRHGGDPERFAGPVASLLLDGIAHG